MRALSRLVWAILRNARAPSTLDCASATWLRWVSIWLRAAASCASAAASDACEDSAFVFALSRSIAAMSPRPWRSVSRAAFRASLAATVRALTRFASWLTALAFADSRFDSATFRLAAAVATAADRKSTRLNSSHLVISYAVFCLKKKNNHMLKRHVTRTTCNGPCHVDAPRPLHTPYTADQHIEPADTGRLATLPPHVTAYHACLL